MQEKFIKDCFQDIKSNYSALLSTASSYLLRDTRNIQDKFEGVLESKKSFKAERKKKYKNILPGYQEDSLGLAEYFSSTIVDNTQKRKDVSKKEIDSILRGVFSFSFLVKEFGFKKSELEELKLSQSFKEIRALYFKNLDDSCSNFLDSIDSDIKPINFYSIKSKDKVEFDKDNKLQVLFAASIPIIGGFSQGVFGGVILGITVSPLMVWAQAHHMIKKLYEDNVRFYEQYASRVASSESRFLSLQSAKNSYILTDDVLFSQVLPNILLKLRVLSSEKGIDYKKVLWRYLNILSSEFNSRDQRWDGKIEINKAMIDQDLFLVDEIRRIHREKKEKRERLKNKIKGFGKTIFS